MIDLDATDYMILCALRDDSRLSLRDLGSKCGLSAPAVGSRVKRLENCGIIRGYTISVSESVFATALEAVFYTKVRTIDVKSYLEYMRESLCVTSCVKIADEYSYMAMAAFDNIRQLNSFAEYLNENFGNTRVSIVLDKEFVNRPSIKLDGSKKL